MGEGKQVDFASGDINDFPRGALLPEAERTRQPRTDTDALGDDDCGLKDFQRAAKMAGTVVPHDLTRETLSSAFRSMFSWFRQRCAEEVVDQGKAFEDMGIGMAVKQLLAFAVVSRLAPEQQPKH